MNEDVNLKKLFKYLNNRYLTKAFNAIGKVKLSYLNKQNKNDIIDIYNKLDKIIKNKENEK